MKCASSATPQRFVPHTFGLALACLTENALMVRPEFATFQKTIALHAAGHFHDEVAGHKGCKGG